MPVIDSQDSYDILLGRDWLHAVNAIANYAKNEYHISKDGKEAKLQGRIYTQEEVELGSSSDESDGYDSDTETEDDEEQGNPEPNDIVDQYLASCILLDDLDIKPPAE